MGKIVIDCLCMPNCKCKDCPTCSEPQQSSWLPYTKEKWYPYFQKWLKQGRTDEQAYGVLNFMTGQGEIMLKDLLSAQRQELVGKIGKFTLYSNPLGCPSCGMNVKRFTRLLAKLEEKK